MQRLEITGNTPEELYFNCIKMLSIMLKGAGSTATPTEEINLPANEANDLGANSTSEEITSLEPSEPVTDPAPEQEVIPPAPKKRGPKPKPVETVEHVKSDELDEPVPDLGGAPAKELTLDGDIKPRLQAIAAACTKRGMSMPDTVAYCQKLYGPFGIAKAPQLKTEQFAEFMEASEAYLDGSAEA